MKKAMILLGGIFIVSLLNAQELKNEKDSLSYALGILWGNNISSKGMTDVDLTVMTKAIEAILNDGETLMEMKESNLFVTDMIKKKEKVLHEKNMEEGENFLKANAEKEGVVTLESGLQYVVMKEGNGTIPKATDKVSVHYHGTLINGDVFDSSVQRGTPASFGVTQVIKGWVEALQLMPVGSKWKLFIPHTLAYGPRAAGAKIAPYSTLIFEVELLGIE
ncbi:MAG: FKBP-type peptidyl-prolyl cis-trans isomerase [Bacteroidota bacterium]